MGDTTTMVQILLTSALSIWSLCLSLKIGFKIYSSSDKIKISKSVIMLSLSVLIGIFLSSLVEIGLLYDSNSLDFTNDFIHYSLIFVYIICWWIFISNESALYYIQE